MEKYFKIPYIREGMVFSDPCYNEDVWCQHRDEFSDRDWVMTLETSENDGILTFKSVIGNTLFAATVSAHENDEQFYVRHPLFYSPEQVELGMDTASMYVGTKEIYDKFGEDIALKTGTDGMFGSLFIFYNPVEPASPDGYLLVGALDSNLINERELFGYFLASFSAEEISKQEYMEKTNLKLLNNQLLLASRQAKTAEASERELENER